MKQLLIAGDRQFVEAIAPLCQSHNYHVNIFHADDLDDQATLDKLVNDAATCDIFIESMNENPASKQWLIEGVEGNMPEDSIVLTNALCASTTETASWCNDPRRVVGFGLLPPIKPATPIEFTPALQTNAPSAAQARDFWQKIGFEVVRVGDTPGLVRARIVCMLINEAAQALDDKIASAEDIDTAMTLAGNLPRGVLAWADDIGLDVVLGTLNAMYDYWQDARYRPAPLLKKKVLAGHVGKRVGQGFFVDPLVAPNNT